MSAPTTFAKTSLMMNRPAYRSVGIWMSVILVAYILFNAVRATLDPTGFAAYYGLPLTDPQNTAFVLVYAIRALFLGLFGLGLLAGRQYRALGLYALIGVVMPVGDAVLVAVGDGGTATVIRHGLTAVFLLVTGVLVLRWARPTAEV